MTRSWGSRLAAFAQAVLLLAVVAVGIPWALMAAAEARFGGRAPLHGVPSPSEWDAGTIRDSLTERLTDQTIADVIIRVALLVAWAAVIVFVVTVVAEVVHMIRHDGLPMPDVRGFGMSQSLARVVAAGLLVVVPMFASPSRAVARDGAQLVPEPRAASMTEAVDSVDSPEQMSPPSARPDNVWVSRSADPEPSGSAPLEPAPVHSAVGDPAPVRATPGRYVVRSGDSIYAIAERMAGPDASSVAEYADRLIDLNLGRAMPDGQRFNNAAYIDVGWVLELPNAAGDAVAAGTAEAPAAGTHVVEQGESLWSIADDQLGDAERWPEIFDANEGRTFDDGRELHDPDLIQPGWELQIPGADGAPAGQPLPAPTVEPVVDTDPSTSSVAAAPSAPAAGPEAPDVAPRDVDEASGAPARPVNVWTDRGGLGTTGAGAVVDAGVDDRADDTGQDDTDDVGPGRLLTLGRAAMLSGGVLTLLAVRRRSRLRRAQPRSVLPEPDARPAATERALRAIDTGGRFERVDVAIRAVALPLVERDERVVAALVAADGALELRTSGPVSLPSPWEGTDERWSLPGSVPLELLTADARRIGTPTPTLVQLGRTPDDRDVYVDLEALEAIEIGGPGDQADAVVAAIAATLAGSVLAEVTTLVGLGVPDEAFLGHRLHVPVRDPQRAFEAASEAIGSTAAQSRSTFELRTHATSGEAWEPAVVVAGSSVGAVTPPRSRTGLAIVSASPIHGPSSRLAPAGEAWELLPAGIRLVPVGLGPDEITAVAELLEVADPQPMSEPISERAASLSEPMSEPGAAPMPPPVAAEIVAPGTVEAGSGDVPIDDDLTLVPPDGDLPVPSPSPHPVPDVAAAPATSSPDWSLLVRLVGPVGVVDRDDEPVEFERSKTRELVAWLATHRERSTRTAARTALWELDVRDATFANVVSEARRALARLVEPPAGDEWVGRTMTEALPLHDLVLTDADLIEHALDVARVQPPAQAIATLTPAVELIAGPPFEGTSYLWPDAEGLTSNLVLLATSASTELAAHCLASGDIDGVFRATGRGLRVLPGHEELIGLRMRAHAGAGDHAGVRHEWESYERVINADPWSDGEPSPKLVELRRELLNPTR